MLVTVGRAIIRAVASLYLLNIVKWYKTFLFSLLYSSCLRVLAEVLWDTLYVGILHAVFFKYKLIASLFRFERIANSESD